MLHTIRIVTHWLSPVVISSSGEIIITIIVRQTGSAARGSRRRLPAFIHAQDLQSRSTIEQSTIRATVSHRVGRLSEIILHHRADCVQTMIV